MAALPFEILLGIYLGLLTGIIPAFVSFGLGFLFKYFTGVTIPALAVVVLSLAIAGANGGLLALTDPTVTSAPNSEALIAAIIIVMMMSLYAHSQGDKLGATFPHRLSLRKLREQTLSADVVELVGGRGQVRIAIVGEVADIEGYPPLSSELRSELHDKEWLFPVNVPLSELETRVADALRTEFELAEVNVQIDQEGRATVAAAPPTSGLSKRIPSGKRAVSIAALVPTGLARGDNVHVLVDEEPIEATVVSLQSTRPGSTVEGLEPDGGIEPEPVETPVPTADGGDGRVTLAVDRKEATRLLQVEQAPIIVRARGTRREFELLTLLRRTGKRVRRITVAPGSDLDGSTIGDAAIRDRFGVGLLAVRSGDGWTVAPRGNTKLVGGAELFAVGTREELERFGEVIR